MKFLKICLMLSLIIPFSAFSFGFKFHIINTKIKIVNFSTYNAYSNGTFAKSCNEYRNPSNFLYAYQGITGDGIYRIKPDSGVEYDVFCDMTTSGGGWTQVMNLGVTNTVYGWSNAFWTNSSLLNQTSFNTPNVQSKYPSFNNLLGTQILVRSYLGSTTYTNYTGSFGSSKTMYQIMQSPVNTTIGNITINQQLASTHGPYGVNYARIGQASGNQYYQNIGWGVYQSYGSCGEHSGGNYGVNAFNCQACYLNNGWGYCYDNQDLWSAQVFIK